MKVECVLPCSSSNSVLDRFSILDDGCEDIDGTVPFWLMLQELFRRNITTWGALLDLLETISVTLRGSTAAAGDYGSLRLAVENEPCFFTDIWPSILRFAIALPRHFQTGSIPKLVSGQTLRLSQSQCASLLAHQFLCSFKSPRSNFYDFSVWYDSNQRLPIAVSAYLKSLFTYFYLRATQHPDEIQSNMVEYTLWSADVTKLCAPNWDGRPLSKIGIRKLRLHSTKIHNIGHLGRSDGVVISANKDIGFGQSATQEELYIGATPEACVAVLFTPQLKDEEALSVNLAQPMIKIYGQRRSISWKVYDPPMAGGRMLLMDALEIDLVDLSTSRIEGDDGSSHIPLPDLLECNLKRELTKAYAAFTSWPSSSDSTIFTGLWGCGAFNGEPTVKLLLLWMAASITGRELQVVFDEAEGEYARSFEELVERPSLQSVSDIIELLRSIAKSTPRLEVMQSLKDTY